MAARRIDDAHGILDGDELLPAVLAIDFRTAEAGQDERDLAGDEMRAIELGGNMRGEATILEGLGGVFRVWRGGKKVSAQAKKEPNLPFTHRLDGFDRIGPMLHRRRKGE